MVSKCISLLMRSKPAHWKHLHFLKILKKITATKVTICQISLKIYISFMSNNSFICFSKTVNILNSIWVFPFLISFFCWNEVNTKLSIKEDTRFIMQERILWSWKHGWKNLFREVTWNRVSDHHSWNIHLKVFQKRAVPYISDIKIL